MHFYSVGKLFVFWTDIQIFNQQIKFRSNKKCILNYYIKDASVRTNIRSNPDAFIKIVHKYLFFCKKKVYKKNFRAAEG